MMSVITRICCAVLVVALTVFTCAGCASGPMSGQRVARYRPTVDNRDVVLADRSAARGNPAAGTTNAAAGVLSVHGEHVEGAARRLQPGDKVAIYLFGIPEPSEMKDVIDDRGNVNLPLIESVQIANKTTYEAERMIERAYVDGGYYRKIEISVVALSILARADECYVRGEVKAPGRHPWTTDLSLTKAIIAAGGFTEYANPRKVQVRRGDATQFYDTRDIEKGKAKDPPIRAGDIIIVHRGLM